MPSPDDLPRALDPTARGTATTAVDSRRNGHGRGSGARVSGPRSGRPAGPSTKPALIVLGLMAFLFVLGVVLEILSGHQSRPLPAPTSIATAPGAVLHAVPARPLLKAIVIPGQPPDDLLNALAVPQAAAPVASSAVDRGVELYDRSLRFEVPATQHDVIAFFRAELPALHWRQLSQGPAGKVPGGYQILDRHPASDGHEWEVGVTVDPTFFPSGASGGRGVTDFTLRLFSVSDQN
jgi:hypothetical protein